jgi:hypothetical protein
MKSKISGPTNGMTETAAHHRVLPIRFQSASEGMRLIADQSISGTSETIVLLSVSMLDSCLDPIQNVQGCARSTKTTRAYGRIAGSVDRRLRRTPMAPIRERRVRRP